MFLKWNLQYSDLLEASNKCQPKKNITAWITLPTLKIQERLSSLSFFVFSYILLTSGSSSVLFVSLSICALFFILKCNAELKT